MTRFKKIPVWLLVMLLPSAPALSAPQLVPMVPQWYDAGRVTRVHSGHADDANAGAFAFSTETEFALSECVGSSGYFVPDSSRAAQRIYATLLMAQAQAKLVAIALTGQCLRGRPEVTAVQIKDGSYF